MKIDFGTVIVKLDGTPLVTTDDKPWTAGALAAEALMAPQHGSSALTAGKVTELFDMAMKIFKGGTHEISAPEAAMIQEAVVQQCAPIAAAQIIKLTNGK